MALNAGVTLVLVPPGRGRWQAIELRMPPRRVPKTDGPLFPPYRIGQRMTIGELVFRVAKVLA